MHSKLESTSIFAFFSVIDFCPLGLDSAWLPLWAFLLLTICRQASGVAWFASFLINIIFAEKVCHRICNHGQDSVEWCCRSAMHSCGHYTRCVIFIVHDHTINSSKWSFFVAKTGMIKCMLYWIWKIWHLFFLPVSFHGKHTSLGLRSFLKNRGLVIQTTTTWMTLSIMDKNA